MGEYANSRNRNGKAGRAMTYFQLYLKAKYLFDAGNKGSFEFQQPKTQNYFLFVLKILPNISYNSGCFSFSNSGCLKKYSEVTAKNSP